MKYQVTKVHSDFYYVENNEQIFSCRILGVLKKQKTEINVGDFVELDEAKNFIVKRLERKNSLSRPKASNIDLMLVVSSFKEPDLNFSQLNRYLIYLKYNKIPCAICVNKEDLETDTKNRISEIEKIYSKLGYKVFFLSAKNNIGISEIKKFIKGKTVALCGLSGVGKTTLLNAVIPDFYARTNEISSKTQRGRHTTRHCEIVKYKDYKIMDTPGFSCLKFDFLLPDELFDLFDDLKVFKGNCKYANCLHNADEKGICSVRDNIEYIEKTRYESYIEFLEESLKFKKEISKKSIKKEDNLKLTGNKIYTKISKRKRTLSRKTLKQKIEEQ